MLPNNFEESAIFGKASPLTNLVNMSPSQILSQMKELAPGDGTDAELGTENNRGKEIKPDYNGGGGFNDSRTSSSVARSEEKLNATNDSFIRRINMGGDVGIL